MRRDPQGGFPSRVGAVTALPPRASVLSQPPKHRQGQPLDSWASAARPGYTRTVHAGHVQMTRTEHHLLWDCPQQFEKCQAGCSHLPRGLRPSGCFVLRDRRPSPQLPLRAAGHQWEGQFGREKKRESR